MSGSRAGSSTPSELRLGAYAGLIEGSVGIGAQVQHPRGGGTARADNSVNDDGRNLLQPRGGATGAAADIS